jgi:FAD/FMN-containing dehydrogenase
MHAGRGPLTMDKMGGRPGAAVGNVRAWGRLSNDRHRLHALRDRDHVELDAADGLPGLPFGHGRSYGDCCLNPGGWLWTTRTLDRFVSFDTSTGVIECEAGVLLDEIISVALPRGWFLPVTPGTRFVTLGGAIANDVHGKNHHRRGTLGEHVLSLCLQRSDGLRLECSRQQNTDWLSATVGGLGLTGVILLARLQLMPVPGAWIDTETLPFESLNEFFTLSRESDAMWEYTVAWIDCMHGSGADTRGVFFRGNHIAHDAAAPPARPRDVPATPPLSLINRASVRAFNAGYFLHKRWRRGRGTQHLLPFLYPLDGLRYWNRLYGRKGFYQYQCAVPRDAEVCAIAELMKAIRAGGRGSFLAVLKTFSDRPSAGLLSFPMAGTTLALDFPNEGPLTERLFIRLDEIVRQAGGRLYPAKDARMPAGLFRQGYPQLDLFCAFRDPGISSAMSRRLLGS